MIDTQCHSSPVNPRHGCAHAVKPTHTRKGASMESHPLLFHHIPVQARPSWRHSPLLILALPRPVPHCAFVSLHPAARPQWSPPQAFAPPLLALPIHPNLCRLRGRPLRCASICTATLLTTAPMRPQCYTHAPLLIAGGRAHADRRFCERRGSASEAYLCARHNYYTQRVTHRKSYLCGALRTSALLLNAFPQAGAGGRCVPPLAALARVLARPLS
jgi:hypothetical protein